MAVNVEKMTAEIDLMENSLYIVKDGQVIKIRPVEHGEDKIIWKNGKVLDIVRSERMRV